MPDDFSHKCISYTASGLSGRVARQHDTTNNRTSTTALQGSWPARPTHFLTCHKREDDN